MKLNDAIIEAPETGECKIDISKTKKAFDKFTFISRWHDEYTLVRVVRKNIRTIKVKINKYDALRLIDELKLDEIKSEFFRFAWTYKMPPNDVAHKLLPRHFLTN